MKRSIANRIKLGIFVSIGISLFIGAVYFLGSQKMLFGKTFRMSALFNDVSGLMVGNNVRFSGINVGTVEEITIIGDSTVLVDMRIQMKIQRFIKKDSKAMIGSEGLMGNKIINIMPGTRKSQPVVENEVLRSIKGVNLDDILKNVKVTSENLAVISDELADLVMDIRDSRGSLHRIIYDTTIAYTLEQTLRNMRSGTHGFSENMEALKHNFLFRRYFKKKEEEKIREQEKSGKGEKAKEQEEESKDAGSNKKWWPFKKGE